MVTPILPGTDIKLGGLYTVENLLAACAAVWGGVPIEAMRQVAWAFTGSMRCSTPVKVEPT